MTKVPALSAGGAPVVVIGTCGAPPAPLDAPPVAPLPEPPAPDVLPPCPDPPDGLPVELPLPASPMRPVQPDAPSVARVDTNSNERDRDFRGFIVTLRWFIGWRISTPVSP
jgi:hypothetical protein